MALVLTAGARSNSQLRADEPFVRGPRHLAVADVEVGGLARMADAAAVEHVDFDHVLPGLAAPGAGIHGQRAAEGAGNAGKEFRRPQSPFHALPGDAPAGHAGLDLNAGGAQAFEPAQRAVRGDDGAANPAVAHQEIAAESDPQQRHVRRQLAHEGGQIHDVARREEQIRRAADMP